eukprot:g74665.t1
MLSEGASKNACCKKSWQLTILSYRIFIVSDEMASTSKEETTSIGVRLVLSAVSGMVAATFCHPLDTIRVQLQVDKEHKHKGMVSCGTHIYRTAGVQKGLYAGLTAAYLRQILYGSCRMGIYSQLLDRAKKKDLNPGIVQMGGMGVISGAIGSFIGTPSELALVRMTADSRLPPAERRNYSSVVDVIIRVSQSEGVTNLWRGALPTVYRASLLSAALMSVTSTTKAEMNKAGWGEYPLFTMFCATSAGSFVANSVVMPLDVVKSRIQNMKIFPGQPLPYAGMIDCTKKIVTNEGFVALWTGFMPAFLKLAPYSIISLTLLEQMTKFVTGSGAL